MKKLIWKLPFLILLLASITFAQTLEETPDAAKAYNEGNSLLKAGNYQGAAEKYGEAVKLVQDYKIYYQKGIAHKNMQQYDKAVEAFQNAVKLNPDFALTYNSLGGIYFAQGNYQEAIDNFKQFEAKAEKDKYKDKAGEYIARAYAKLGLEAKNQGDFNKAVEYFNNAVANADFDAAYIGLAEVYVEQTKYEEALQAADNAINNRKSISKGAGYYYKGLAFKGLGQKEKAIENFEIAKKDNQYKASSQYHLDLLK